MNHNFIDEYFSGEFYWYSNASDDSFVCSDCNKSYSSKAALKNHQQSHEGKTSCTFCGRTFSSMSNLNKHIKNHHTRDDGQSF